jgi:HEAT repeat protein
MKHASWEVRTQIARVLGKAISRGEEHLLITLLSDKVWWVRYRAGQSLAALPFLSSEELWQLRYSLSDEFAQDILDQVVAEMKIK